MPGNEVLFAAFDKLRDESLAWPHTKEDDLIPEECSRTGWVLFKSCLIARCGPVAHRVGSKELMSFDCGFYPPGAMYTAAGAPIIIDHDNIGDFERGHGFIDGPARRLAGGDLVVDVVITDKYARDIVATGGHCISVGATWLGRMDDDAKGRIAYRDQLKSINHVALLPFQWGAGAVPGAQLTGADLWCKGHHWVR